jgi:hypothetical protein
MSVLNIQAGKIKAIAVCAPARLAGTLSFMDAPCF